MTTRDVPAPVRWERRAAVRLLAGGAAWGAASLLLGDEHPAATPRQAAASTIQPNAVIRGVLADIPAESLAGGGILIHEHLSLPSTPEPAAVVAQVVAAAEHGIRCIVDAGHVDMGRSLDALREISRRTQMPVVGSAGYWQTRSYPAHLAAQSDEQIAADLVAEARDNHLGAFGEIGQTNDAPMNALEEKVFRAVGKAHARTNLPIFTHNAYGTGPNVPEDAGLRQLDVLESVGVDPARVVVGHACCRDDPSAHTIKQVARRSAFVGFDRVTGGLVSDDKKVRMILALLDAGYEDHLVLSSDYTGRQTPSRPHYGIVLTRFVPLLRLAGISDDVIQRVTSDNPRRFLAFVPRRADDLDDDGQRGRG